MVYVRNPHSKRGFTLIELLLVIGIVAVLSTVVFASLSSARERARDARRRSDLIQVKLALEFYYEMHGQLPALLAGGAAETSKGLSNSVQLCGNGSGWDPLGGLESLTTGNFISQLPVDPTNSAGHCYIYKPNPNLRGACVWNFLEQSVRPRIGITVGEPDPTIAGNPYPDGYECNFLNEVLLGGTTLTPATVCGNAICEIGETTSTCPTDCVVGGPICGNFICELEEDPTTCPLDCGGGGSGS